MIQQANIYACSFTDPVGRAGGEGSLQPGVLSSVRRDREEWLN
jgi:hypothetical protein